MTPEVTLVEMRQCALDANWGTRKCDVLDYLAEFKVLHSDSLLCSTRAAVSKREHSQGASYPFGRRVDCSRNDGPFGAAGNK